MLYLIIGDIMPHCSKCKKEKETMHTARTCEECAEIGKKYYHSHKNQRAVTNEIWRKTPNGKAKQKAACKRWRDNNRERYRELAKSYTKKNSTKPSYRMNKAKQDAKSRNLEFTLTLEEYTNLISHPCYYCNGVFGHVTKGTGLDRINSNLGYVATNVVSCCTTCNRIKSDIFTVEETFVAVKAILQYRSDQELGRVQAQDHTRS
jgi:hypothetical protein